MSKLSKLLKLLLCLVSVGVCLPVYSESVTDRELQIKAAYIYNFTKFITWNQTFLSSENFNFCIVEDDYFTDILIKIINRRYVAGKKTFIRNIRKTDLINDCHLIYIPQQDSSLNDFYLKKSFKTLSLTVGNNNDFNKQGGIIRFYTQRNKLKFEINNVKATEAGYKIKPQLLMLGKGTGNE